MKKKTKQNYVSSLLEYGYILEHVGNRERSQHLYRCCWPSVFSPYAGHHEKNLITLFSFISFRFGVSIFGVATFIFFYVVQGKKTCSTPHTSICLLFVCVFQ